ncbi:MarR family winged helix-turn-helix transcriptional regulator [Furfurilactobacillus sp. WILCCON 0119]|uniref:MarR family winged helix-turn-helix transcriptional regulator n=1 Tax=Furfurilactobacillus entadae TaxID=2922307 RepID=UPI0035EF9B3D
MIENTILRNVGSISRALDSISNIEFKSLSLEKGQYLYLSRVVEHPGITQMQLSTLLSVDKTTTNRAISKLIEKNIIVKSDDEFNQKNKLLYATPHGEKLYQTLKAENQYSDAVALTALSDEEIALLDKLLEKVSLNVVADWAKVKKGYHRPY